MLANWKRWWLAPVCLVVAGLAVVLTARGVLVRTANDTDGARQQIGRMEMYDADPFEGLSETNLELATRTIHLSREDARGMGRALSDFLRNGDPAIRDALLRSVEHVEGWIDSDGVVRTGPWVLNTRDDQLVLTYRTPPQMSTSASQYVARLANQEGRWVVESLEQERLLPARR